MNGEFAIATHAMVYLDHMGCCVSSERLADNICTNPARVRKVMSKLIRAGFVESRPGAGGGYLMSSDPDQVSLADVASAVGGRIVGSPWHPGDVDRECLVSSGMGAAMEDIYGDLDALCMRHLASTSVGDVSRSIFRTDA